MEQTCELQVEAPARVEIVPRIWAISFNIMGGGRKGCAVVKAPNPSDAINVLTSSGIYNATPKAYLVTKVEEIVIPPCCGLMAEEIIP